MRWSSKTTKNKLIPHRNRTHKNYKGGLNVFGISTDGERPVVLQPPKDKTLPFMYFYNFAIREK